MKKSLVSIILISIVLLFSIFITEPVFATKNVSSNVLYVGGIGVGNYTFIQEAIDDAHCNDVIYVYDGVYKENLVIDKPVSLIGENKHRTIIDGDNKGNTVEINAENVMIHNFTITNASQNKEFAVFTAGIRITANHNIIRNNIFKNNSLGVFGLRTTNITLEDNVFYDAGICFSPYENKGRPCNKMKYFIHNIKSNTVNDRPLFYFKNQNDICIENKKIGQIIAVNCSDLTINNVTSSHSEYGLLLYYSDNCKVENSTFSNDSEIWIFNSCKNKFRNNILCKNFHGITLDYHSSHNIIEYNNCSNNQYAGVMIEYYSHKNIIRYNNLMDNKYNGFFTKTFVNKWYKNYYDDWIGLKNKFFNFTPKIIPGMPFENIPLILWFNADWHPICRPYKFI